MSPGCNVNLQRPQVDLSWANCNSKLGSCVFGAHSKIANEEYDEPTQSRKKFSILPLG